MADAVPYFLILLSAVASAGVLEIRRSLRLSLLIGTAALLGIAAAWAAAPLDLGGGLGSFDLDAADLDAADRASGDAAAGSPAAGNAAALWAALAIGGSAAALLRRPPAIIAVVGLAALVVSRLHSDGPASAGWIAALQLFAVTGLAGLAAAGFGFGFGFAVGVVPNAPPTASLQRTRCLARVAAGLLLGLIAAAVMALLTADNPLGLSPQLTLLVLPAEAVAGLCVWRAWEHVVRAAAVTEATTWRTWTGVLAVFAMAGVGLAIVPTILTAGVR